MISVKEYQERRRTLAAKLPPDSIAIIPGAEEILRNGDSHYRFRQDSDFYYLSGFNEPEALLLITSGKASKSFLFNRPRDKDHEQWTGKRLGQEEACRILAVDGAYSIHELDNQLPNFLAGKKAVYYSLGRHPAYELRILQALQGLKKQARRGTKAPETLGDLEPLIAEMRLIKSAAEIALMRRAAEISVAGHLRAMKACKQAVNERQLEAELFYEFIRRDCQSVAYNPIVAAGANACILHYTDNDQPLKGQELLLIDAAGEFENYAADITRTFPINGHFSAEQKVIYELVLKAQRVAMDSIKPGLIWGAIQETIVAILTQGLCELGLLKGKVDELIKAEAYKPFYMHNSGHWLGLDVHDSGAYQIDDTYRPLKAGMVLTIEPGLYISPAIAGVDSRWWNIGVRIEDDILVTEKGYENLTASLPVEVAEIEALLRG